MNHFFPSYTEKSTEIQEQKRTYSSQKGRPLYKIHIHSSTRGIVTNVSGLWDATSNDAAILLAELRRRKVYFNFKLTKWILALYYYDFLDKFKHDYDAGVILLADRGYRFITEDVESFGIKIFIPAIQQERLNLGDADSQVLLVRKSLKLFL